MGKVFYIYRHINKTTNEVFYIGKGTVNFESKSFKKKYSRAYVKTGRSILWNRIVEKYGYIVEIVFESKSERIVLDKEIELIDLYGRLNINKGTLANLTDGGEKGVGKLVSNETKIKISKANKGRKYSKEVNLKKGQKGKDNFFYGKSFKGKDNPFFGKKHSKEVILKFTGENNPMYGMTGDKNPFFGKTHTDEFLRRKQLIHSNRVIVNDNGLEMEFECVRDCAEYFNCTTKNILRIDKLIKNNGKIIRGRFVDVKLSIIK